MNPSIASRQPGLLADNDPANAHRPDSLTLRYSGDIRTELMSGAVFVLQSAHPVISTALNQHSRFREEPWKRLQEIAASGQRFIYSGQEASLREGQRLREIHRKITGEDASGQAYHALNPEAYGWVHTVFLDSTFRAHELYGEALPEAVQQGLFLEWLRLGDIFGLRRQDMPRTLTEYRDHFRYMLDERLEYSPLIAELLSRAAPPQPESLTLPAAWWPLLWKPAGMAKSWLTLAALPENFRRKVTQDFPWTEKDERNFQRWRLLVRGIVKSLPARWRQNPDAWAAMQARNSWEPRATKLKAAGLPPAY